MPSRKFFLSLDALLLILLGAAQLHQYADSGTYLMYQWATLLLVWAITLYVVLEWRWSLSGVSSLADLGQPHRFAYLLRLAIVYFLIFVFVVLPLLQNLIIRFTPDADPRQSAIHDGAYQVELAIQMVLDGQNPYAERFTDPVIADYMQSFGLDNNPAVDHYVYLPGVTYLSIPFYALSQRLMGVYDQRIVYVSLFILGLLLIPWMVRSPEYRLALPIGIALNPLINDTVVGGMNDFMLLPFLVGVTLLFLRRRWLRSALFLGLACTLKQNIWPMVPFFLLAQWTQVKAARRWRMVILSGVIIGAVMALVIGPSVLSDPAAFYDDTVAYINGNATGLNYPIRGYSLGFLLLSFGVIVSPYSAFPLWIPQLLIGLPVLLALLWQQYHDSPTPQIAIGRAWFNAGLFILLLGILSRFFHHNYFGFTIILMFVGYVLLADEGGNGRENQFI